MTSLVAHVLLRGLTEQCALPVCRTFPFPRKSALDLWHSISNLISYISYLIPYLILILSKNQLSYQCGVERKQTLERILLRCNIEQALSSSMK